MSTLGWWEMTLLMAGGLEPDELQGPFQPKPFHNSMILNLLLALVQELESNTRLGGIWTNPGTGGLRPKMRKY